MANLRSLIVKIGADTQQIEKALASVGESAKTLDAGLKKLGTTPLGKQTIQDAEKLVASVKSLSDQQQKLADRSLLAARGLQAVGGPARLMKTELDQVAKTVQRGLDAFRALGQQAPEELRKVSVAIQQQQNALKGSALLGRAGDLLGGFGFPVTGAAVGTAFVVAAKQALDYADSLTKLADRTGVGVTALQRLAAVARNSGNSLEQIADGINKFQRSLVTGDTRSGEALARIGLSFDRLRTLSPEQQFTAIAKAIQQIKDPAEQAAVAMALFGKSGADLLPSLKADVDTLTKSAVVMSEDSVKALDAFGDGLQNLKAAGVSAAGEIVAAFLKVPKAIKEVVNSLPKRKLTPDQQRRLTEADEIARERLGLLPVQLPQFQPLAPELPGLGAPGLRGAGATQAEIAAIERQSQAILEQIEATKKLTAAKRELFSTDLIARANTFVAALGGVQNLTKLTASEQQRLRALVTDATAAYVALGDQAPLALQRVKRELDQVLFAQHAVSTTGPVGGLVGAPGTLFDPDEFRNIAAGFQADGSLIIQTLDAMAEHARETADAFERFFGITSSLSLGLPTGQVPANRDAIDAARGGADADEERQSVLELDRTYQHLARTLEIVGASTNNAFGQTVQFISRVIEAISAEIAALRSLQGAAYAANAALGFFGIGWMIGSFIGERIFGATGGEVTPTGIQHFEGGGRVLPFLARGTDTVPAMLTPGEVVLNKQQQSEIAGALFGSGGGTVINNWAGVVMTPDVYRDIARKSLTHSARAHARNTDSFYSRTRAGLGLRS